MRYRKDNTDESIVPCRVSELPPLLDDFFYHSLAALLTKKGCQNCFTSRSRSELVAKRERDEHSRLSESLSNWQAKAQAAEDKNLALEKELGDTRKKLLELKQEHLQLLIAAKENDQAQRVFDDIEDMLGEIGEDHDTILLLKNELATAHLAKQDYGAASGLLKGVVESQATHKDEAYKDNFKRLCEALRKQGQTELKEAELLLRKEEADNQSSDEWKLEVGDILASVLAQLGSLADAINQQRKTWKETKSMNGSGYPEAKVQRALHFSALLRSGAEEASQESQDTDRKYYEENNSELVRELRKIFKELVSSDLCNRILLATYELGQYYLSHDRRDKRDVAKELLEWTREQKGIGTALSDKQRTQLLESLEKIYNESNFRSLKAEDVFEELYDARRKDPGPSHDKTLDCGYQLSRLLEETKQTNRQLKAATIMKEVFDCRQKNFRTNQTVTKQLLDVALFCGTLLLEIVESPNIDHSLVGEPATLYQIAEEAFRLVWYKGPNCPEFQPGHESESRVTVGHNLMKCLKAQQDHVSNTAPRLSGEIWSLGPPLKTKLELGALMGEILIGIETSSADRAAIEFLQDLWQESNDLRCGKNYGVCLTRLAEFEKAYEVLSNVKNRTPDGTFDLTKCGFNFANCLMAKGLYEDARMFCMTITSKFPPDDKKAKWAAMYLKKIDDIRIKDGQITEKAGEIFRLANILRARDNELRMRDNELRLRDNEIAALKAPIRESDRTNDNLRRRRTRSRSPRSSRTVLLDDPGQGRRGKRKPNDRT
jgi:hypothetical protein